MKIKSVDVGYYRIPLPIALSDSRHGYIRDFELVTVTIESDNGLQGVGYTYTCLLYTSPSPRDGLLSRMPSSA